MESLDQKGIIYNTDDTNVCPFHFGYQTFTFAIYSDTIPGAGTDVQWLQWHRSWYLYPESQLYYRSCNFRNFLFPHALRMVDFDLVCYQKSTAERILSRNTIQQNQDVFREVNLRKWHYHRGMHIHTGPVNKSLMSVSVSTMDQ